MKAPVGAPGPAPGTRHRPEPTPTVERALQALGVDPIFAEAVLGDLSEEYAERAACDVNAARRWYVGQALRSAPHLIRSAAHHPAGRARLAAVVATLALVACVVLIALSFRAGPPVRLVAGTRDTVVVNNLRPVSLPMRVFDAAGRLLPDSGVRYAQALGAPISISSRGVVTCARPGDATVRASLGPLATNILVRCRPVRELRGGYGYWTDFVLGDSARELDLVAVGIDGRRVTQFGAWLSIDDSTVAVLDGLRVHPRSPGETRVDLRVGDRTADFMVRVFEPVHTLVGLRADQRLVAAPVRLARGASVRWPLPTGRFSMSLLPTPDVKAGAMLSVDGAVMCMPALAPGVFDTTCVARVPGAWVTVAYPGEPAAGTAAPVVVGTLALHRDREP